jgi:GH25 family lysozyme M1 (1,4-beta-N-acetylmuramidase)
VSRIFSGPRMGVAAVALTLASLGGLDVALVTSGGNRAPELARAAAAQSTPAPASQALAAPSPAASAAVPSAGVTTVPATPPVVATTPPVVDGVRRNNVGSAHSPQLLQQLAAAPATMPPPAEAGALGVDVADFQHPGGAAIDWGQVAAAGYKFAFIKVTEGDYYANPYYASDLAQAKAAGLYVAGYHFAIPNVSDGASQADYAIANGGYTPDGHTLPLALDIEYNPYGAECYGMSPAQIVSWVSAFTAEVQRVTSQLPIIYTTADWWNTCTGGSTGSGADPLWVAGYVSGSPPLPAGWGNWTFWQYTSRGSVPGISGNVDVSYFLQAAVRLIDPGNQQNAVGTAVQLQVTSLNAADGQTPRFAASNLPPGLSISGSGLITGTISSTATGTYPVTVTATSPSGATGSVSFVWTVTAKPSPPLTTSPSPSPSSLLTLSPSATPTPTDSASPTPSDSASGSDSASPTDSATATDSATPTPTPSDSATPTPTPSDSASGSPSASGSASTAVSPSATSTAACPSPSASPTDSVTPTPTDSASATPSVCPS